MHYSMIFSAESIAAVTAAAISFILNDDAIHNMQLTASEWYKIAPTIKKTNPILPPPHVRLGVGVKDCFWFTYTSISWLPIRCWVNQLNPRTTPDKYQ